MKEGLTGAEMFLVRIGDEERGACLDALTEHHILGRLSAEEFDRRQSAAFEALTAADLGKLVADLPALATELQRRPRASSRVSVDARAAAMWAVPPVVIVSTATFTSTVVADASGMAGTPAVIWASVITGAVGYATHWAVSLFRNR